MLAGQAIHNTRVAMQLIPEHTGNDDALHMLGQAAHPVPFQDAEVSGREIPARVDNDMEETMSRSAPPGVP